MTTREDLLHPVSGLRPASPVTKALCGEYLETIEAMATALGTTRAEVIRSIFKDWFETHKETLDGLGLTLKKERGDV